MSWLFSLLIGVSVWSAVPQKDAAAQFAEWAKIREPRAGLGEPIGTYAAGCLSGAVPIPADGVGYASMRPSRHRLYAHASMRTYLEDLGHRLADLKMPLLLIGDVGPARGGPMLSGHNSHQIGLDADLWLRMSFKRPTRAQRESWGAPSFVAHRKKLKKNWGSTQVKLISLAADSPLVNRIFVSPPIKRYFCEHEATAPWLYKLRPWWGHEEHVHVRLDCPTGSTTCVPQPALNSSDNGCGNELTWWFSEEADAQWKKLASDKSPRQFPELPAACAEML
jgi:penicillin-insensitive murein endopeptidase